MGFEANIAGLNATPSTYALITSEVDITSSSPNLIALQCTVPLGVVTTGGGYKLEFYLAGTKVDESTALTGAFPVTALKNAPIPYIDSSSWVNVGTGWEVELLNSSGWFTGVDTSTQFDTIKLTVFTCAGLTWTYGIRD